MRTLLMVAALPRLPDVGPQTASKTPSDRRCRSTIRARPASSWRSERLRTTAGRSTESREPICSMTTARVATPRLNASTIER
jgi:hypothetical protein